MSTQARVILNFWDDVGLHHFQPRERGCIGDGYVIIPPPEAANKLRESGCGGVSSPRALPRMVVFWSRTRGDGVIRRRRWVGGVEDLVRNFDAVSTPLKVRSSSSTWGEPIRLEGSMNPAVSKYKPECSKDAVLADRAGRDDLHGIVTYPPMIGILFLWL